MVKWSEEEKITSTASEDFKSNLIDGKRYVDKTEILVQLLRRKHETTFFLRPRRFGKTLTLSMIRYFVEDTRDEALNAENRELFEGLKIMEAGEYYTSQMTSYPVINLTMQTLGDVFLQYGAQGFSVGFMHRILSEAAMGLDTLPHSGALPRIRRTRGGPRDHGDPCISS